jgi:hypothetical protein
MPSAAQATPKHVAASWRRGCGCLSFQQVRTENLRHSKPSHTVHRPLAPFPCSWVQTHKMPAPFCVQPITRQRRSFRSRVWQRRWPPLSIPRPAGETHQAMQRLSRWSESWCCSSPRQQPWRLRATACIERTSLLAGHACTVSTAGQPQTPALVMHGCLLSCSAGGAYKLAEGKLVKECKATLGAAASCRLSGIDTVERVPCIPMHSNGQL